MDDATTAATVSQETAPRQKGLATFFALVLGLAFTAAAIVVAIVFLVPEENDYARATLIKHERLATARPHKIVLVGGSNLAFGIDSTIIARETQCDVANMGMNGHYGVRYMLEEVRPQLRAGDVVVIAFEYDNYFKPTGGDGADLLMVVKANPAAFNYINWSQRLAVLEAMPYVAQQKVLRFIRYGFAAVSGMLGTSDGIDTHAQIVEIETAQGFTNDGDLTTHLGVDWPYERELGIDLTRNGIDAEVVPMMAQFAQDMEARGVAVVVSYSPILRAFYTPHANVIDQLHQRMTQTAPLAPPSPPQAYVYDEPAFFDTVYHLNAAGRGPRTEQIVQDMQRALGAERVRCAADSGVEPR